MYVVENRAQPEHFASIPETMWWSLITLTTVGYGDVAPVTGLGKIIGAFTALMGVCVVALLTGIVATAFANQIDRRKLMLEAEIASSLEDGVITDKELIKIRQMQKQMHLTDEHIQAIIELMRNRELPRE
jgi:voltage-gated potassium channel